MRTQPRHALPSRLPGALALTTTLGTLLVPLLSGTAEASAGSRSSAARSSATSSTVRVSAHGAPVAPGEQTPVAVRLISGGAYVRNGVVDVQVREGSGWRTLTRVPTDAQGLGSTTVSATSGEVVRAYYRGSRRRAAAMSPGVAVRVQDLGQRAVDEAARHQGAPYVYGAAGPGSFDCSGFTRYVYGRLGRSLPHDAAAQAAATSPVGQDGVQVGDLIFFHTDGGIGHVGIYAGNGTMWDAPKPGGSVQHRAIYSSSWSAGRVG